MGTEMELGLLQQLFGRGLWVAAAIGDGIFLYRSWSRFVRIRTGWLWSAAMFAVLGIVSITVIWIGDPNLLYVLPVVLLAGVLCTRGSLAGRLAVAAIFFSLIMSVNATLDTYLELLTPRGMLSRALRPAVYGGLYLLVRRRLPEEPPELSFRLWRLILVLAAMPLCALSAVVLLTSHWYRSPEVNLVGLNQGMVVLPFVLLTAVALLTAILLLADHERLERAEQLAGLREVYYQGLREQEGQVRTLRHDLRNHLTVLRGLLERGETARALGYLEQLAGSPALRGTRRLCENEAANAVLSAKAEAMERAGIAADIAVSLPAELPVEDVDLCALLGNALDNAMEGGRMAGLRGVTVRCRVDKGLLMLRVANPVGAEVRPDLTTTKADRSRHGFGIPGMREIAERYGGTLEAGVKDGRFELVVCLPVRARGA